MVIIDGMAGVGKTALAVGVARRLIDNYPDGQFFVDLQAHAAGVRPLTATDALYRLLVSDGVSPRAIAADLEGRAAQWRNRVAGRSCIVLIDNAFERLQVAPLLPPDGGCLVLVTSRRRLVGLSAQHVATCLTLDPLAENQAIDLFMERSGRVANAVDIGAMQGIVRICGMLPLAICVLAARFAASSIGSRMTCCERSRVPRTPLPVCG